MAHQTLIYEEFAYRLLLLQNLTLKFCSNQFILSKIVYFYITFLIIKNEELRINNKPKNKRRRIYD